MSHIHIPDGVLPLWLVLAGWLLTVLLLGLSMRRVGGQRANRLPLLGVMVALMIVAMNVEIAPIAYHINLAVLTGVMLGPALGLLAAFLVNLMLALMGHGGVTVVGLNTLLLGTEVVAGWALFRIFARFIPGTGWAAAVATWISLFVSTLAMIGIVALSSVDLGPLTPHGALEPETLQFRDPFGEGILRIELGRAGHEGVPRVDLWTFARVVVLLGAIGWTLEAFVTGVIAAYLQRVAPHLMAGGAVSTDAKGGSSPVS
jgi:cobalt/nickel transport system permease protein